MAQKASILTRYERNFHYQQGRSIMDRAGMRVVQRSSASEKDVPGHFSGQKIGLICD